VNRTLPIAAVDKSHFGELQSWEKNGATNKPAQ
jgi:hypothetical protein